MANYGSKWTNPPRKQVPIVLDAEIEPPLVSLYVGTGGDVIVRRDQDSVADGALLAEVNVPSGGIVLGRITKVLTGTTALDLVGYTYDDTAIDSDGD